MELGVLPNTFIIIIVDLRLCITDDNFKIRGERV
jgi:hypothetical protein